MKLSNILYVFIPISVLLSCTNNNDIVNTYESEIITLNQKIDSLVNRNKVLENKLIEKHNENKWLDDSSNFEKLKNKGVDNPQAYIVEQLQNNTSILPIQAVLGGTMQIDNIKLISEKWIFANYSDGHIYGESIINYDVDKNGDIKFKVLLSEK